MRDPRPQQEKAARSGPGRRLALFLAIALAGLAAPAPSFADDEADLGIQVTDAPDPVIAGGSLVYTLRVTNSGPDPASAVKVVDDLPDSVQLVGFTAAGWTCQALDSGDKIECRRDTFAVGAASPIVITVQASSAAGSITNKASIDAGSDDPSKSNDHDSESTLVAAVILQADLSVTQVDSPDPVHAGGDIVYTVQVVNSGPDAASDVRMEENFPQPPASASGEGWVCSRSGLKATCTRPSLPVGSAPPLAIVIPAPSTEGTWNALATVSGSEADPAPVSNTDAETPAVGVGPARADLAITKIATPNPVAAGGDLTYTLQVHNAGPRSAENVTVTDVLPGGATLVSVAGGGWDCAEATGVMSCTRASLAKDAAVPITIKVFATLQGGPITSTASVAATTEDPDPSNNSAAVTVTVEFPEGAHDLAVVKLVAPRRVELGRAGAPRSARVKVRIQNRSEHDEIVQDMETMASLVRLTAGSLGSCPSPQTRLVAVQTQDGLPVRLRSRKSLNLFYEVVFDCANDPARGTASETHDDFSFLARVMHSALGGSADVHSQDDVCPRAVGTPFADPYPDGSIMERGCGGKLEAGGFGAAVMTDIVVGD